MQSDDIVARLRDIEGGYGFRAICREAADEIERLRRNIGCARNQRSTQFCAEALDAQREIERLRAERDEARRMWCEAEAVGNCLSVDDMKRRARTEAKRREWDCFKEAGHGR